MFLGIESPDAANLLETKKFQNRRQDMLSAVRRIYASGTEVLGWFIVGFDNDTPDTFERQYDFITRSGIQGAMVGLLTAPPKTPLYYRLEQEGKLLPGANDSDNTMQGTSVVPLRMKYDEIIERYRGLYRRLMSHRNIADRIRNKVRFIGSPAATRDDSWIARIRIIRRMLLHGILPGGVPRMFPLVEAKDAVTNLSFSMRGCLDHRFFKRAGHHFVKVLQQSTASITLRIEALHDAHPILIRPCSKWPWSTN